MAGTKTIIIEHPIRHMYYWNAKTKQKLVDSGYFDNWETTDKDTLLRIMDEDLNDNVFKSSLTFSVRYTTSSKRMACTWKKAKKKNS